jgi:16S rRNA (cytidine1402-2'-O)-methyltransferase
VARTVTDLREACGAEREVVVAREITKLHQEVWRGPLAEAAARLADPTYEPRGEWVIVLAGAADDGSPGAGDEAIAGALQAAIDDGMDRRGAVARVAEQLRVPKRRVYDIAVTLKR